MPNGKGGNSFGGSTKSAPLEGEATRLEVQLQKEALKIEAEGGGQEPDKDVEAAGERERSKLDYRNAPSDLTPAQKDLLNQDRIPWESRQLIKNYFQAVKPTRKLNERSNRTTSRRIPKAIQCRSKQEVAKVIVGYDDIIECVIMSLLANGHVLLEGVPGLGKTSLSPRLRDVVHLKFSRIQFTPDLMPADITGTNIVQENARARSSSNSSRDRSSPTLCWPTKSIAPRRKLSRRCWRPWRRRRFRSARQPTSWTRRFSFLRLRTLSRWKAPIRCRKRNSTVSS